MQKHGIHAQAVETAGERLALSKEGRADVMVYEEPLLCYLPRDSAPGIEILPHSIERQYYAFGLMPGFARHEALDRTLLADAGDSEGGFSIVIWAGVDGIMTLQTVPVCTGSSTNRGWRRCAMQLIMLGMFKSGKYLESVYSGSALSCLTAE
jgi:hypothetical protein